MFNLVHKYLTGFIKRRQQANEFSTTYKEYLKEEVATSQACNTIQLILVRNMDVMCLKNV